MRMNPPLARIGTKNVSRFVSKEGIRNVNADWRPFVVSVSKSEFRDGVEPDKKEFELSESAVKAIFAILSSFYNFLIQEEVTGANPFLLIRQKSKFIQKRQTKAPVRRISNLQWDYVIKWTSSTFTSLY